jgi:hypothetical protein
MCRMGELSEVRLGAVRKLIEQVPDRTIRTLESVLASSGGDRSFALVSDMINAEKLDRRLRASVFAPIAPLCEAEGHVIGRLTFPPRAIVLAWQAVKAVDPDLVEQALRDAGMLRPDDDFPPVFDEICLKVVHGLEEGDAAYAALAALLGATKATFTRSLSLAPLARTVLPKLPVWVRTLSNEPAAAIRLAFRDATAVDEDAGPAFMELLYGQLEEPWQVLRLISLVMDRPSDRYLASSELAVFGERLMGETDRRIELIRRFDWKRGREAGVEAAVAVQFAVTVIAEFEQWFEVARDGPWGRRLAAQKRSLALAAEARLKEADSAVGAALPVNTSRLVIRTIRGEPDLSEPPAPDALCKAEALVTFVCETRTSAGNAGFATNRAKVVDALDARIAHYADDIIDNLHSGEGDLERARAFLDAAAELLGLVRDPRAADILRRRAAIA